MKEWALKSVPTLRTQTIGNDKGSPTGLMFHRMQTADRPNRVGGKEWTVGSLEPIGGADNGQDSARSEGWRGRAARYTPLVFDRVTSWSTASASAYLLSRTSQIRNLVSDWFFCVLPMVATVSLNPRHQRFKYSMLSHSS